MPAAEAPSLRLSSSYCPTVLRACRAVPGSSEARKCRSLPALLFRKVAKQPVDVNGHGMTAWEAYVRQVHEMAKRTSVPRSCFNGFGRHFRATSRPVRR